jgi:hypothetical protein
MFDVRCSMLDVREFEVRKMKKITALLLVCALFTGGCASASGGRAAMPTPSVVNTATMSEYVQRIPAGSRVRVERTNGQSMRATLMKATAQSIVVQRNTRVAEPPIEIPVAELARVTLDQGGASVGKAVAIGLASGVGAFFAIVAIAFAASYD